MSETIVSDSELDAAIEEEVATEDTAAEETTEETHEEEKEEEGAEEKEGEEETAETGDKAGDTSAEEHKTSSRLGRKVKNLEDRLAEAISNLEKSPEPKEELDFDDENASVSLKDVRTIIAKAKKDEEDTKVAYNNTYLQTAISLSESEEEEFANTVLDEMDANFNTLYSNDPARDAETNYLKAQNAVLRKSQNKGKDNPLKGKKPKAALGVTGGDNNTQSTFKMPVLDEHAQDLIKHSDFTEQDIRDALEGKNLRITGEHPIKNV